MMELLIMAAEPGHGLAHTIAGVPHRRRRMTSGSEGVRRTNGGGASHQGTGNIGNMTERGEVDDDLGVEVEVIAEVEAVPAVGAGAKAETETETETEAGTKREKEVDTTDAVGGVEVVATVTVTRIDREVIGRNLAASKRQKP